MIGQGQSKNLRWRLMLGCLTPLVISLVLQASYTMAQQRREMMQGLGDKASSLAHLLVNVVGPSMMVDDPKAVDEGLDYVAGDPDFGFAVALDVRGGVIAYRGPGLRRAELSQNTRPVNLPQLTSASEFLVSAFPVESGGRNMGSVHIGLQTTTVRQRVASMAVRAAIISVAGIAIAVLVVSVLATTIVHRNRDMQLLLDSMTEGLVTSSLSGEVKGHRSRTITRWFGQPARST